MKDNEQKDERLANRKEVSVTYGPLKVTIENKNCVVEDGAARLTAEIHVKYTSNETYEPGDVRVFIDGFPVSSPLSDLGTVYLGGGVWIDKYGIEEIVACGGTYQLTAEVDFIVTINDTETAAAVSVTCPGC
jgi:hypothetical protein